MASSSELAKTRVLTTRIVKGLRKALQLSDAECYSSIAPAYIEGQPDKVVQVCPGGETPFGGGQGAQEGGGVLLRNQGWILAIWWRLHLDEFGQSAQVLEEASGSVLDFSEQIRDALAMTFLGDGMLIQPLMFGGASAPAWFDEDGGIVGRQLRVSGPFNSDLPDRVTLSEGDFL